jgi:tRNA U34 5-methylaminomethyl-2-thiouridine-forming methyltransferase MnmC
MDPNTFTSANTLPEIVATADGTNTLRDLRYDMTFHSLYGAAIESEHVYLQTGLKHIVDSGIKQISILEIGYGTGLNALLTWLLAKESGLAIRYEGWDNQALPVELLMQLKYTEYINNPEAAACWQYLTLSHWNELNALDDRFELIKRLGQFEDIDAESAFDLIYFDAFGPTSQPTLWEEPLIQSMHHALKPGGVLVTYCAQGAFRRTLKSVGFSIEKLAGPPGKREITRATKAF